MATWTNTERQTKNTSLKTTDLATRNLQTQGKCDTVNSSTSEKANPFSLEESSLDTFSDVNSSSLSVNNNTFLNESNSINELESNLTLSRNLSVIGSEISNSSINDNETITDDVIVKTKQLTAEDITSRGTLTNEDIPSRNELTQETSTLCKDCPNEPPEPVQQPPPYPSDEMLSNQNQDMKIIKETPEFTLNKHFQPRAGRIPQSWIDSKPDIVEATPRPKQRSTTIKPIIQPIFDPELPPPPPGSFAFGKKEMVSIPDSQSLGSDLTVPITTEDIKSQHPADFEFPPQPEVELPGNSQPFKITETASDLESQPILETVSMDQKLTSLDIKQPLNQLDEEPPPPPPHFSRPPTMKFKQDRERSQPVQSVQNVLTTSPPEVLQPRGQQLNAAASEQPFAPDQHISEIDKQIIESQSDQMSSDTIEKQTTPLNPETLHVKQKIALESDNTGVDQQRSFTPDQLKSESQQLTNISEADYMQTNETTVSGSLLDEKQNMTDQINLQNENFPTTSLLDHMPSINPDVESDFATNITAEFNARSTAEFEANETAEFVANDTTEVKSRNTSEVIAFSPAEFVANDTTEFTSDSIDDKTVPISEINQISETINKINNTMNEEIALPRTDQLQNEQQLNSSMDYINQISLDTLQPDEWYISENQTLMETLEQNITGSEKTAEIKALNKILSSLSEEMSNEGQLSVDQKLIPQVLENVIPEDQISADIEGELDKKKIIGTSVLDQDIIKNGSLPMESETLDQISIRIQNASNAVELKIEKHIEESVSGLQQLSDSNLTQFLKDNEKVKTTMENEIPTEIQTITDTNGTTSMFDQLHSEGQLDESLILGDATDQQLEPSSLTEEDNELLEILKTTEDFSAVPQSESQHSQNTTINDGNQTQSVFEQLPSDVEQSVGTSTTLVEITTLTPDPELSVATSKAGVKSTTLTPDLVLSMATSTTEVEMKTEDIEITTLTPDPVLNIGKEQKGIDHTMTGTVPLNTTPSFEITTSTQQPPRPSIMHSEPQESFVTDRQQQRPAEVSNLNENQTFPDNTQQRQDQKNEEEINMETDIPPPPPRRRTELVEKERNNLPPSLNVLEENRRKGFRQISDQTLQSPELSSELPPPPPGFKQETKHVLKEKPMTLLKETGLLKSQQDETDIVSQAKYSALFNRNSPYYQSMWKINTNQPSTKIKPQTTLNSIDQRQSSNSAVRKMINTIEQVRTRPKSVDSLTFFTPGVVRTRTHQNTNRNSNVQSQRSVPPLSKQNNSQQSAGVGIPHAGYTPGVPFIQNHFLRRKRWNESNLPMDIAFKTAVPKQEQSNNIHDRMAGGKKYIEEKVYSNIPIKKRYSLNDLRISKLNRLNELNRYSDVKHSKHLQNNIDINKNSYNSHQTTPRTKHQIKDIILHGKAQQFKKSNSKVHVNVLQNQNKNDAPPPIILRTADSTVFKVSYTPPPPPPRKLTTVAPPETMSKPLPENKHISPKQFKSKKITSNNVSKTSASTESNTKSTVSVIGNSSPEINPSYTRELSNASETCDNCTYVSDFCYLREPTNCNRFIVCYKQGHKLRATEKECSFGLFWSQSNLACTQPSRAQCQIDPCRTKGVRSHPYIGKCRAYWTCRRRRSDARCCPNGYAYGGGRNTCVPNKDCKTNCITKIPEVLNVCPLRKVSDSPFEYTDGGMVRSCAPGTRFEESMCACIRSNVGNRPVEKKQTLLDQPFQCEPAISLDFSGSSKDAFEDKSGQSQSIGVSNVLQTIKKQAMFNGRGSLKLWRFSNVELGPEFALRFKFYAHGRSHRSETLLSNCIGKRKAAFDIRLETDILEIVFTVKTSESPESYIRIFYKPHQWNEVILRYDGASFSAALGKVSKTIYVEGVIPTKHAAISIGGCGQDDGFIGYMDDVIIYNGCIPEDVRGLVFE
ncbi:Hypothetical predicted protein [Mytilus galloprovincialis]|uniref:Chitin-binding type-2 domain-containing protein n=1 Tax=Mytilus galloprovincialis TaxID=29158 RepID=A0A8B6GMM2_MYTGA|nr:Hypothetical predicted protein [Mytilus galloprovincialis]